MPGLPDVNQVVHIQFVTIDSDGLAHPIAFDAAVKVADEMNRRRRGLLTTGIAVGAVLASSIIQAAVLLGTVLS